MGRRRVTIERLTRESPSFFGRMGPFLSRREIVRELGSPVWDDDGAVWFVAVYSGATIGFCACRRGSRVMTFGSDYVAPAHRGRGVYELLFQARMSEFSGSVTRAVARPSAVDMYRTHGFRVIRRTKAFAFLERKPHE